MGDVISRAEWMLKRRALGDDEKAERSQHLEAAQLPFQQAITERAIRELLYRVKVLEERGRK